MSLFNESEWIKLLFMLGDMQAMVSEIEKDLFSKVPADKKRKLFQPGYHITASSFAHIIERHYHKIPRHMGVGKFTIPVPDILDGLRNAAQQTAVPIPGSLNFYREFDTDSEIGFDRSGCTTKIMTVITSPGGCIKTAFPGDYKEHSALV
jgi:hypothetical protein